MSNPTCPECGCEQVGIDPSTGMHICERCLTTWTPVDIYDQCKTCAGGFLNCEACVGGDQWTPAKETP